MTTSAKRKKEKKKDFQKTKFKVGKAKAKADNFTSTAFSSTTISIKKQSSITAPSTKSQISHHLSVLRNPSNTQHKDSLAYLKNLPASERDLFLHEILPVLPPIIFDSSSAVRTQMLELLKHIPAQSVIDHHEKFLHWTHAGMTHLSQDIRSFSLDVLNLLLDVAAENIVSCKGGWMLTLRKFITLLRWEPAANDSGWSSLRSSKTAAGSEAKVLAKQLATLAKFITAGIKPPSAEAIAAQKAEEHLQAVREFPLADSRRHRLPHRRKNPFAHLNLFGEADREEKDVMLYEKEERRKAFKDHFLAQVRRGTEEAKKQGGEVGRAAATVSKAVDDGMDDGTDQSDEEEHYKKLEARINGWAAQYWKGRREGESVQRPAAASTPDEEDSGDGYDKQ